MCDIEVRRNCTAILIIYLAYIILKIGGYYILFSASYSQDEKNKRQSNVPIGKLTYLKRC